jgi:hypothetical protein
MSKAGQAILGLAFLYAMLGHSWGQQSVQQQDTPEQHSTERAPVIIQMQIPAQLVPARPDNSAKDDSAKHVSDKPADRRLDWLKSWTLSDGIAALALIAFVAQAIYLRLQARELRKSARDRLDYGRKIERAYVSGGGAPVGKKLFIENGVAREHPAFQLDINNFGHTPAELWDLAINWCEFDKVSDLPELPTYKWYFFRDAVQPGIGSRPLKFLKIPTGLSKPVIYGRYYYRDIFGDGHSNGFIQREGTPIVTPHLSYTEADPEWDDLSRIGKRQYEKEE